MQRLLVACRGCWWHGEVVGGKRRLLAAASHYGVHRFQNQIYHQTLAFPGLRKGLPPVDGLFKGQLDPSSYSARKFMALFRLLRKKAPQMNRFWQRSGIIISNPTSYS